MDIAAFVDSLRFMVEGWLGVFMVMAVIAAVVAALKWLNNGAGGILSGALTRAGAAVCPSFQKAWSNGAAAAVAARGPARRIRRTPPSARRKKARQKEEKPPCGAKR